MRAPGTTLALPNENPSPHLPPLDNLNECCIVQNVSRFDFALPPRGVKALLVNCRNEKIAFAPNSTFAFTSCDPTLTYTHSHSFTRSVSQKLQHFLPVPLLLVALIA